MYECMYMLFIFIFIFKQNHLSAFRGPGPLAENPDIKMMR